MANNLPQLRVPIVFIGRFSWGSYYRSFRGAIRGGRRPTFNCIMDNKHAIGSKSRGRSLNRSGAVGAQETERSYHAGKVSVGRRRTRLGGKFPKPQLIGAVERTRLRSVDADHVTLIGNRRECETRRGKHRLAFEVDHDIFQSRGFGLWSVR